MRAIIIILCASGLAAQDRRMVGAYYHPGPGKEVEIRRMIEGDPGGRPAFSHTLAPVIRTERGKHREVWQEYLTVTGKVGKGRLACLLDVHVMATPHWLNKDRLFDLLIKIKRSPLGKHVAGWYICDEPFGRSHPDRKNSVDLSPICDLVSIIRRVGKKLGKRQIIVADYGSVFALLKEGGDPVKGGFADYTSEKTERAAFLWRGQWVRKIDDEYGKPRVRSFGFFGEDITMINWWNDASHLRRWRDRIAGDVPLKNVQIVLGYDHSANTPKNNDAWVRRTKAIVEAGDEMGLGGYWFWAWQEIPSQGRTYKGLGSWWESVEEKQPRYAALIESIR